MTKTIYPSSVQGTIYLPRSKSHAIRALVLAALADGRSTIDHLPDSLDVGACVDCLKRLGVDIKRADKSTRVSGNLLSTIDMPRKSPIPHRLDCKNSGTTLFILTSIAALAKQNIALDGDNSLRKRSAAPLLEALQSLGVLVESGPTPPIRITGPITQSLCSIDCPTSQFLTSLLITLPFAPVDTQVTVTELKEIPYVEMTLNWLDFCNITYTHTAFRKFTILGNQRIQPFSVTIGRDASAASFFACAAALKKTTITLADLSLDDKQGDYALFDLLESQGCSVQKQKTTTNNWDVKIDGSGFVGGGSVSFEDIPDAVPAYAVLASAAQEPTTITHIAHVRQKECDRIAAIEQELSKMSIRTDSTDDSLTIYPGQLQGAELESHGDHRILMALSIAALAANSPSTITGAQDAAITYPQFFEDLASLGARINET